MDEAAAVGGKQGRQGRENRNDIICRVPVVMVKPEGVSSPLLSGAVIMIALVPACLDCVCCFRTVKAILIIILDLGRGKEVGGL